MSQVTAENRSPWAEKFASMRPENITLPAGSGSGVGNGLIGVGAVCTGLAFASPLIMPGVSLGHPLASFHVGAMSVLACCMGAIFFLLIFSLVNAGWTATIRRQFENIASLIWIPIVMVGVVLAVEVINKGVMFRWMGENPAENYLLGKKSPYLNIPRFVVFAVVYAAVWLALSRLLVGYSQRLDETGDKAYAAKIRTLAPVGMICFAFTLAFASFDWLMSQDIIFFSTMWPVYFLAGCAFTSLTTVVMIFAALRLRGKLQGVVTEEHFHDLGKLLFGFTCFWAYIAFFQYFLIWYANIPEETAWFLARSRDGWEHFFPILAFGHFVIPFLILIFRPIKRNPRFLLAFCGLLILMQLLDVFWVVRPVVYAGQPADKVPGITASWIDVVAIAGAVAIFAGFLIKKVASGPLVPLNDPRMGESLKHKNYV